MGARPGALVINAEKEEEDANINTQVTRIIHGEKIVPALSWFKWVVGVLCIALGITAALVGAANAGAFGEKLVDVMACADDSSSSSTTSALAKDVGSTFWVLSFIGFTFAGTRMCYVTLLRHFFWSVYYYQRKSIKVWWRLTTIALLVALPLFSTLSNIFFSLHASEQYSQSRRAHAALISGPIQTYLYSVFSTLLLIRFLEKRYNLSEHSTEELETLRQTTLGNLRASLSASWSINDIDFLARGCFYKELDETHQHDCSCLVVFLSLIYIPTHTGATFVGLRDYFEGNAGSSSSSDDGYSTTSTALAIFFAFINSIVVMLFTVYANYQQGCRFYAKAHGQAIIKQGGSWLTGLMTFVISLCCLACTGNAINLTHEFFFISWLGEDENNPGILLASLPIGIAGTFLSYTLFALDMSHELAQLGSPTSNVTLVEQLLLMPYEQLSEVNQQLSRLQIPAGAPLLA